MLVSGKMISFEDFLGSSQRSNQGDGHNSTAILRGHGRQLKGPPFLAYALNIQVPSILQSKR